jgi:hypothetical protein
MGAGASSFSGESKGSSMFEALQAQEEAKEFYILRIAELMAKVSSQQESHYP